MYYDHEADLWESKFGPECVLADNPIRGYWILHIPQPDLAQIWSNLTQLTESGKLGYLISKCRESMEYGHYAGRVSICCFELLPKKEDLFGKLHKAGFGKYITKFRLIKKFRNGQEGFDDMDKYAAFD